MHRQKKNEQISSIRMEIINFYYLLTQGRKYFCGVSSREKNKCEGGNNTDKKKKLKQFFFHATISFMKDIMFLPSLAFVSIFHRFLLSVLLSMCMLYNSLFSTKKKAKKYEHNKVFTFFFLSFFVLPDIFEICEQNLVLKRFIHLKKRVSKR